MPDGNDAIDRRMGEDFASGMVKTFSLAEARIVFFSDLHRGDRSRLDRFKHNAAGYLTALESYFDRGYFLVLIGDVEEGWGFDLKNPRHADKLLKKNRDLIAVEKKFLDADRLVRIVGNHDDYQVNHAAYLEPWYGRGIAAAITRSLILRDSGPGLPFLVMHGCQGQPLHDIGDPLAQTAVRLKYIWQRLLGIEQKSEALKYASELAAHQRKLFDWSIRKGFHFIAGHTHFPYFDSLPLPDLHSLGLELTAWADLEEEQDFMAQLAGIYTEMDAGTSFRYYNSGCGVALSIVSGLRISDRSIASIYLDPQGGEKIYRQRPLDAEPQLTLKARPA